MLRRRVQKTSVSSYLSEFRNIVLALPNMSAGEQVDRFCQDLEVQAGMGVIKSGARTINDASRIALNVGAALFDAGMFSCGGFMRLNAPTPVEIGNFLQKSKDRKRNRAISVIKLVAGHGNV